MTSNDKTPQAPAKPLSIQKATIRTLRLRTSVRAGQLGNNPGGQG